MTTKYDPLSHLANKSPLSSPSNPLLPTSSSPAQIPISATASNTTSSPPRQQQQKQHQQINQATFLPAPPLASPAAAAENAYTLPPTNRSSLDAGNPMPLGPTSLDEFYRDFMSDCLVSEPDHENSSDVKDEDGDDDDDDGTGQNRIRKLRIQAHNRSWRGVIETSTVLLNLPVFKEALNLIVSPSTPTSPALPLQSEEDGNRIKQLLYEIIYLRMISFFGTKDYKSLGFEVVRLRLLPSDGKNTQGELEVDWPVALKVIGCQALLYSSSSPSTSTSSFSSPSSVCVDKLNYLYSTLSNTTLTNTSNKVRIKIAIAEAFSQDNEWRLAIATYDEIISLLPGLCESYTELSRKQNSTMTMNEGEHKKEKEKANNEGWLVFNKTLQSSLKIEMLSRTARIFLHTGLTSEASIIFTIVSELADDVQVTLNSHPNPSNANASEWIKCVFEEISIVNAYEQSLINKGLMHFVSREYSECIAVLNGCLDIDTETEIETETYQNARAKAKDKDNDMIARSPSKLYNGLGISTAPNTSQTSTITNNIVLSNLYLCTLPSSILALESLLKRNPKKYMNEVLVFNLCTLYDLSCDNEVSKRKKCVVRMVRGRFDVDCIGEDAFRI